MNEIKTIADIGINHNGSIERACRLIVDAHQTKFWAVKFQKRNPTRYPERLYNSPVFGETTYRDHKERLEFGKEEYDYIDTICRGVGIFWSASVFDFESVDFMMQYKSDNGVPFIKIPSPVTLNLKLVKYIAERAQEKRTRVIMSTGMCDDDDIERAYQAIKSANVPDHMITILHCCSEYPTPATHVNLNHIEKLRDLYAGDGVHIGYSSHDGGVAIPANSVSYGAEVIEVHITESRLLPGSDHNASLEYMGMRALNQHVIALNKAKGDFQKVVYDGEIAIKKKVAQSMATDMLIEEEHRQYVRDGK